MDWTQILPILFGGIGTVAGLWSAFSKASSSRVDDLVKIIESQREEINRLDMELCEERKKLNNMRDIMVEFNRGIKILIQQVTELGHVPAWTTDEAFDREVTSDSQTDIAGYIWEWDL